MLTREVAISTVLQYINACKALNIKLDKVIVFGSVAAGNQDEMSDIDVALVSDDFTIHPLQNRKLLAKANIKYSRIEAHPFSNWYFNEGNPFIDEIKRTGITLEY